MRTLSSRQIRKASWFILIVLVMSCVSRTTPEARVRQSLASATYSNFTLFSGSSDQFSFAAVGDLHIGGGGTDRLRAILNSAAAEGDEFILFLGDIVDQGRRSDVEAFHTAIHETGWDGKVFCVAGNHDIFEDGWDHYRDLTGSSTYAFTAGNAKFIALDTADATLGSQQTQWLKRELEQSSATHTFLFSHYLPLVPGQSSWLRLSSETESLSLMSLATRHGVRAWLGAHYHSYIKETIEGVTYIIAGGGGGRRMPPVKDYFFVQVRIDGSNVDYEMKAVP